MLTSAALDRERCKGWLCGTAFGKADSGWGPELSVQKLRSLTRQTQILRPLVQQTTAFLTVVTSVTLGLDYPKSRC